MNIIDKMKKDWDRRAKHNAKFWIAVQEYYNDTVFINSGERDSKRILDGIKIDYSWYVLDIGCGIGRLLRPLSKRFKYICGVDVSKEMVLKGKKWLTGLCNVDILENNGIDLSFFKDNTFDFVYAYIVFQHMSKEIFHNYLLEINRVLKPSGLLKFQIYLGRNYHPLFEDTFTCRIYDIDELIKDLDLLGFKFINKSLFHKESVADNYFVLVSKVGKPKITNDFSWKMKECIDQIFPEEQRIQILYNQIHGVV